MEFGGGFKPELMHDNGHVYWKLNHTGNMTLNQFNLNLEKEFWRSKSFNFSNIQFNLSTQIRLGVGINQVGKYNLTETYTYYSSRGLNFTKTSNVINLNSGALNIG